MPKTKIVRFAAGKSDEPFSNLWRLVVDENEVYIGASRQSMGIFKLSLHQSGVWILAATEQSGAMFQDGNRRAKKWNCPPEHVTGVTRGPSIVVPRTTRGSRTLSEKEKCKEAIWIEAPGEGELVEFSVYFVEENTKTKWNSSETVVAELGMARGSKVILLASTYKSPPAFLSTCERLLQENVVGISNPSSRIFDDSFLWVTESKDNYSVPLIVDLPVPTKISESV